MGLDSLLDNNDNSSKYIAMYDKQVASVSASNNHQVTSNAIVKVILFMFV